MFDVILEYKKTNNLNIMEFESSASMVRNMFNPDGIQITPRTLYIF